MEEQIEKKPFCDSCDSKGRFHKKGCPKITQIPGEVPKEMTNQEKIVEIEKRAEQLFAEPQIPGYTKHPDIRAGVCEFCGEHHTVCKHYKGIDIYCTYCGRRDIVNNRHLRIFTLHSNPNQLLIVCGDYKCDVAHKDRFLKK